jgi:uncharacterized protein (TIGR02466 family)
MSHQRPDGGLYLFPPLIYKYQWEFDRDTLYPKLQNLFDLVEINSDLEKGNALSTVSLPPELQPHGWEELADFQSWLGEKIYAIRNEHNFYNGMSNVVNSWANRHYSNGETLEHSHNFVTFVASCYFSCPPNSGNIVFKDPLEYHKATFPVIPELSFNHEVEVQTNDVLIFPGWLKHSVLPSKTDEERIVITFNIK